MTTSKTLMELKEDDIRKHYPNVFQTLSDFSHSPRYAKAEETGRPAGRIGVPRRRFRSTIPGMSPVGAAGGAPTGVSLIATVAEVNEDDPLNSETQNHVLRVLRRALAVASAMVDTYGDMTKLNKLKESNVHGRLSEAQQGEFGELLGAAALIGLFTLASHVTFSLANETADAAAVTVGDPEEIVLDNPLDAVKGVLWELDRAIGKHANDDAGLVKVVKDYSEKLIGELLIRREGLRHLDAFLSYSFRVEADGFTIDGFAVPTGPRTSRVVMQFKQPHEVVGNHIAKHQCLKLAKMLMAYDFKRQLNPFVELGGFIFTFMGDGRPGTGKTTLIQMLGGLLNGYCENAGYPFRYQNLSGDQIDSYQGKSGQNAKQFILNVVDPHVIGFGTIDDIDQVAGKRGDRQSSAGQQEITGVLMESFAGANTVVRGNCTFGMFSNYPEAVDDALRQRAGARFLVDGPQTREDYIDILALLLGKNHDIPTGDVELFVNQNLKKVIGKSYKRHDKPQEERLLEIFQRTSKGLGKLDTIENLGSYLKRIQEVDDRFTGRSIKNITDAVKMRAMDFEIPDEWVEKPDLFLFKDYDDKKRMIAGLMKKITPAMIVQEINRYADSEFRYAGKSDDAAVNQMVREFGLQKKAREVFARQNGLDADA